jgi:hypothetical protein
VLGEVLSFSIFSFSLLFSLVCRFSCLLLVLWLFPLPNDHLKLSLAFWSSSCASYGLGFELQTLSFVVNGLIKGENEKPRGQFLGLIVMSH